MEPDRTLEYEILRAMSPAKKLDVMHALIRQARELKAAARQEIDAFIERYNRGWLLERHGYRTPAQVREELTLKAA